MIILLLPYYLFFGWKCDCVCVHECLFHRCWFQLLWNIDLIFCSVSCGKNWYLNPKVSRIPRWSHKYNIHIVFIIFVILHYLTRYPFTFLTTFANNNHTRKAKIFSSMCVDIFRWMDISKYENKEAFDFLTHQCIANCIFLRGAWGGESHDWADYIPLYNWFGPDILHYCKTHMMGWFSFFPQ